jgi:glycosyltransferase involved in cell wall biosynthesis
MSAQHGPRLLLVVHSAKPAGAQLVALGQAEALSSDHEIVTSIGPGALRPGFARVGPVIRQPTRVPIWGAPRRRWALELARALPDAIRLAIEARRRRIEVIVANSSALVAPVLAGRLARVPVIIHVQEAPTSPAVRRLLRFHGRLATTVVALSPWIADHLGSCRSHVLLNPVGIAIPVWRPRSPRPEGAPIRLLAVGTIDAHKRQDVAICALAKLRNEGVAAELELVGRVADEAYAEQLHVLVARLRVEAHVRFVGESSDVEGHMRAADVLLVPAGEVTPLVIMEAMAIGTPVVAARMGSIPDVVIDGESGLLTEPGNAEATARAVRRIAEDPALAATLAARGRERVERHFDANRSHEALREEIRRVAVAP